MGFEAGGRETTATVKEVALPYIELAGRGKKKTRCAVFVTLLRITYIWAPMVGKERAEAAKQKRRGNATLTVATW